MFSNLLKILSLVVICGSAFADNNLPCTDYSGTFRRTANGQTQELQIEQVGCDVLKTSGSMSLIAPNLKTLFLWGVPSTQNGLIVSGRWMGSWPQITVLHLKNGNLDSTTSETLRLYPDLNNRLMISVKNYNSDGVQIGVESDYDFLRVK